MKKEGYSTQMYLLIGSVLFFISVSAAFIGGFYLQKQLSLQGRFENRSMLTPTPSSTLPPKNNAQQNSEYRKGKQYVEDTIIAVTESAPHAIFISTVARQERDIGADQSTRVSYFNGENWTRKTLSSHHDTSAIYTNSLISAWNIDIDQSRVLKQRVTGESRIDSTVIQFNTNTITNNIPVRSLPGYTKFMSTGEGDITVQGVKHASRILYVRIYSNNAEEIQFYDPSLDVTTHWVAFWTDAGDFYHIDVTDVGNPTDIYKTHQLGVFVDREGGVHETFQVEVHADNKNPPHNYDITLGAPIYKTIHATTNTSINKDQSETYDWYMSDAVGSVDSFNGFGLAEYIHH